MKKNRSTKEQIAFGLRQTDGDTPIVEVCRKMGVSEQTFFRWKKKLPGMGVAEVRRLKTLVADLSSNEALRGRIRNIAGEYTHTEPGRNRGGRAPDLG